MAVVGEASYLDHFVAIFGKRQPEGIDRETEATLEYEDDNRYDPLAVVVKIDGTVVGYLSRIDARLYRQAMERCACPEKALTCAARVRCGWDNGCGSVGDFSVTLALDIDRPVQ